MSLSVTIEKNATAVTSLKSTVSSYDAATTMMELYVKTPSGTQMNGFIGATGGGAPTLSGTQVFQTIMVIALGSTDAYVVTKDSAGTILQTSSDVPIASMSVYDGGGGGGGGGGAVCFLGSAPVLTPAGWARIDSLSMGDIVRTADGRDVAVTRVKHQRIEAPSAAVNPYVIPKGQWGATENLAISPRHCVAVPGRGMVEARELGLKQMPMRAAFDYYNLELPEWDNMVVAGVEVESLAPKKRVAMTVEQLAGLLATVPAEKRATVLAKRVTAMADGKVTVEMSRKERRMKA